MLEQEKDGAGKKKKTRLLLPKIDVIFKLLFGDDRNKDILIEFLKSVLTLPEDEYVAITINDPQLKRELPCDKLGIVDVRLRTKNGKIIHIEMQVIEIAYKLLKMKLSAEEVLMGTGLIRKETEKYAECGEFCL